MTRSDNKVIEVVFYRTETGGEPVREWLLTLSKEDRFLIGTDIKTVEYGWPIGMPTCRPLGKRLYEVRTSLEGRIARVMFCVSDGQMFLLHGFIKKSQKTPKGDLELARKRMKNLED